VVVDGDGVVVGDGDVLGVVIGPGIAHDADHVAVADHVNDHDHDAKHVNVNVNVNVLAGAGRLALARQARAGLADDLDVLPRPVGNHLSAALT
jgi:hypothetical protein